MGISIGTVRVRAWGLISRYSPLATLPNPSHLVSEASLESLLVRFTEQNRRVSEPVISKVGLTSPASETFSQGSLEFSTALQCRLPSQSGRIPLITSNFFKRNQRTKRSEAVGTHLDLIGSWRTV
jgi:hypothetical protein